MKYMYRVGCSMVSSWRKRRIKPAKEAEHYVKQKADKPGLEAIFVDEYTGRFFIISHYSISDKVKVKRYRNASHSYGTSPAIWDHSHHTVLPAT